MNLNYLLQQTVINNASDLHLCAGISPVIRINGDLHYLNEPVLVAQDCERMARQCLSNELFNNLVETGEVDASY